MEGALEGLLVIDAGEGIHAGYCSKLLAGLGADVIKVEQRGHGDSLRSEPPFKDDVPNTETSTVHLHLGMAKRSITLDLESERGRELLRRLIGQADIFVESFKPGTLAGWGMGAGSLRAERPGLIVTSITPFGQEGPYAQYEVTELIAYAAGGYAYLTGLPDREPLKAGGSQAMYQAGLHAMAGTMAALNLRDQTGEGDHIDVSIAEAICFAHGGMSAFLNNGTVYARVGARLLNAQPRAMYPSTILPCKDGYIHAHYAPADPALLGVLTENERLSDPELWETPRAHADEIDELLSRWLAQYDKGEAVRRAQELRHPFTEVLDPADLFEDVHFKERGFFQEIEHPVAGTFGHVGPPLGMAGTPWVMARAPLLGEHTSEVLAERLGLTDAEIEGLRAEGVI